MSMQHSFSVQIEGRPVEIGLDDRGRGPIVLLLPALSSISTRGEMAPLARALAPSFRTIAIDWPGFGAGPKPAINWTPDALSSFVSDVIGALSGKPCLIVAAGHAATYALHEAARNPGQVAKLVLIAPTWRGPLPTMMKGRRPWFGWIRAAVDAPIIGRLLYRLNLSGPVIDRMARQHVYSDPTWLQEERLEEKRAVTTAAGARHASVRFVTGALDRVGSRDDFLDLARRTGVPIMVILGEETPPRSRAEMEALGALDNVEIHRLPKGRLGVHEEFPEAVAALARPFLTL